MNAVDGDTDIDKKIWYELAFLQDQDCKYIVHICFAILNSYILIFVYKLILDSAHLSIEKETGLINVLPINRDALDQEVFPFKV